MNRKLTTKWAKALQSGNYEQCEHTLRKGCHYCALGVGVDVLAASLNSVNWEVLEGYNEDGLPLSDDVPSIEPEITGPIYVGTFMHGDNASYGAQWHFDMSGSDIQHIIELNDEWDYSLEEIGKDLEEFIKTGQWPDWEEERSKSYRFFHNQ